jgi:hypothetical protein
MKQVYPQVRPRRLGTRGNSRYCYAGLKKKLKLEDPFTPEVGGEKQIYVRRKNSRVIIYIIVHVKLRVRLWSTLTDLINANNKKVSGNKKIAIHSMNLKKSLSVL